MVLKKEKITRVLISERLRQDVEEVCSMHTQRVLPGCSHLGRGFPGNSSWDSQPPTPVTPLPFHGVALHQPLGELPQEAYLISLTPPLLRVNSQVRELLPVVHTSYGRVPDMGEKLSLYSLQSVDGGLLLSVLSDSDS